jgi:hypothetical protein
MAGLTSAEARSRAPIRAFKAVNACPATGEMGPDVKCPGYVVDHKWPRCAGGPDTLDNLQYQEYRESLVKDRVERAVCRLMSEVDRLKAELATCRAKGTP